MDVPTWAWIAFIAFIIAMLSIDLFLHRDHHAVTVKEAAIWSLVWVAMGTTFGGVIWWLEGSTLATEYITGYLIEKSLSVDNIFVFALIFSYFAVPLKYQHNVLFWGIFGALGLPGDLHLRRHRLARAVPLDDLRLWGVLDRYRSPDVLSSRRGPRTRKESGAQGTTQVRAYLKELRRGEVLNR